MQEALKRNREASEQGSVLTRTQKQMTKTEYMMNKELLKEVAQAYKQGELSKLHEHSEAKKIFWMKWWNNYITFLFDVDLVKDAGNSELLC